jgi:HD-GYP domain-containing protein (c-di-GMP phosphodiesterase class II)/DNA-binding CsgD family transcriptional regulator
VSGELPLAGTVAALSVVSDLTRGHPPGEAMRACLLASELAKRSGLDRELQVEVFYATLMRFAGCVATSHETAGALGGDDNAVRARGDLIDATRPWEALGFLAGLGSGWGKVRVLAQAPRTPRLVDAAARADCEVGADLTRRLLLPEGVRRAVLCAFERFDGKGSPEGLAGDELSFVSRYAAVGYAAVMFDAVAGREAAVRKVRAWAGRALDPTIAAIFLDAPDELIALSDPADVWAAVVAGEPAPRRRFRDEAHVDEVLAGFGDVADLKAPFFQGHSRGVARIARAAAAEVGVDPVLVYRAGLVHDLGRVAIPTGVWERPGPLRAHEWEMVRLHPYHSGRILSRSPLLSPLAPVASRHHERLDGSGYPAGVGAGDLDATARLLAAADVWHALAEERPHRAAVPPGEAARVLAELPLDRRSVRAVLRAADAPRAAMPPAPVYLTPRELDVLRLLVQGRTKRQIAGELFVSQSTVHTHTVHIYAKCQVSTRAGLAMFAMRHGLASHSSPT